MASISAFQADDPGSNLPNMAKIPANAFKYFESKILLWVIYF